MNSSAGDPTHPKIAILGAGSWGATLTWLLASAGRRVSLWSHDAQKVAQLRDKRKLEKPLAITVPASVDLTAELDECLDGASLVLFCCTAQSMRSVAVRVQKALQATTSTTRATAEIAGGTSTPAGHSNVALVSAAKGIELGTFDRMSTVLAEAMPTNPIGVLSGPNLAAEILGGLPAASVIACNDADTARFIQEQLSVPTFRVYTNDDVVGVEIGGAVKNVIAIAAGVVDGLALGTNAKASMMTRGLAEMTRMAVAMGGKSSTLAGLSGMGDLVATCYSSLSRNYRLGFKLAKGETLGDAEKELGAVAEGVTTARAVCELSQKLEIELPIAEQVDRTLRGISTPSKAIMSLMARPLASE